MSTLFFIDGGYYTFYRYYATLRWHSFRVEEVNTDTILENSDFLNGLYNHIDNDVTKWQREHQVKLRQIFLCVDCPRGSIWRCKVYPEYKGTRVHADTFQSGVFELVQKHLAKKGIRFLSYNELEADDIVSISAKYLSMYCPNVSKIVILTNDNDYQQLSSDHIKVMNMQGKLLNQRGTGDPLKDKRMKIVLGDKSDNIPSVCKGVGPKTLEKVIDLPEEEFKEWLFKKGGQTTLDRYAINQTLVDFDSIPTPLRVGFEKELENLIQQIEMI